MDDPNLTVDDIMASRGWHHENPVLKATYMELRQDVTDGRKTEKELNVEMNKLDNQLLAERTPQPELMAKQEKTDWNLYLTDDSYQTKIDQDRQRQALEQEELQKKQGDHVL